jgi:hypothetical protein
MQGGNFLRPTEYRYIEAESIPSGMFSVGEYIPNENDHRLMPMVIFIFV